MKRTFDILFSLAGIFILSPLLILLSFLIWLQDFNSPLYISKRVGKGKRPFNIFKLRTMVHDADRNGVESTSSDDKRITFIGRIVRKYKIDELTQLWNVLRGNMSLVGPRPNTESGVSLYTKLEEKLWSVKPGITDFSSIVFSDEGEILKGSIDPDLTYNKLIRPGKSYLGLFYIENSNLFLDLIICFLTLLAIFSKDKALFLVVVVLNRLDASKELIEIAKRDKPLRPMSPPGLEEVTGSA